MRMNLLSEHARELLKAAPEWEAYSIELLPHAPQKATVIRVQGVVAPLMSNGRRNWRKGDKSTRAETYIPIADHMAWLRAWEQRTGKCWECEGTGRTLKSAGPAGTFYRPCAKCAGTGKPTVE